MVSKDKQDEGEADEEDEQESEESGDEMDKYERMREGLAEARRVSPLICKCYSGADCYGLCFKLSDSDLQFSLTGS